MNSLTYIWHDCFIFENDKCIIIFDYWKNPDFITEDPKSLPLINSKNYREKKVYVLISHHHKDHYNPVIFELEKYCHDIKFIISKDIERHSRYLFRKESIFNGFKPDEKNIVVLKNLQVYSDESIKIYSFRSTDTGNSYAVEIEGLKIFHAGDLNAWTWKDESDEDEIQQELNKFKECLSEIYSKFKEFDLAMFPVDPRMRKEYFEGASIFVRQFKVSRFFPMHFTLWESEEEKKEFIKKTNDFEKYANPDYGEYIGLVYPYSQYLFT